MCETKNFDSRLHEYPDAKKMTEIPWDPVWGGLLWSPVDVVFLTVFPRNPQWHTMVHHAILLYYGREWHQAVQYYCGVKSVSFLLLSDRYHEEGSHIELFFFIQSKVAALLLAPADIQGGREGGWSFQHYGCSVLVFYKIYHKPWVHSVQSSVSLPGKFAFSN